MGNDSITSLEARFEHCHGPRHLQNLTIKHWRVNVESHDFEDELCQNMFVCTDSGIWDSNLKKHSETQLSRSALEA